MPSQSIRETVDLADRLKTSPNKVKTGLVTTVTPAAMMPWPVIGPCAFIRKINGTNEIKRKMTLPTIDSLEGGEMSCFCI